jgi:catechol-2,3-dioxygenase
MHITELTLKTAKLSELRTFYEQVLGLPLQTVCASAFTIQAGETQLTFQATEQPDITYHFAFTISRNKLNLAKDWLQARDIALMIESVQEEISTNSWKAHSLYFHDPANNIAEFIVHDDLRNDEPGNFGPQDIARISEIGLVVESVPAQVARLKDWFDAKPYKDSFYEEFAAIGDIYGLFIVVKAGRPWRPTTTERAVIAPVRATITGKQAQSYHIASLPYEIDVAVL